MSASALLVACAGNDMPVAQLPEIDTNNPLLAEWETPHATPPFDKISISDYEPAFETAIAVSRAEVDAIVNNPAKPSFNNTILALEKQGELLDRISSVFFNMLQCNTSDELQAIAMRVQPKLTELGNDVSLNPELFKRVKAVYDNPGWCLSKEDKKLLENTYKSFVRSGANLNDADKELYRQYSSELSQLTLQFGQNSLAANNAFALNITDAKKVAELPDFVKEGLAMEAKARGQKGWTVTLKAPSYVPFVTYSSQRDLKEKLSRARGCCAIGGKFDNTENIRKITTLRLKMANLLGYER
ncbi:MAG: M3 family peptidase, partial [Alistipes sp.]|nr:M3 family peptidase [Alistipes sp.]